MTRPTISLGPDGTGLTFEWWREPRKLTIDAAIDGTLEYTRVWGADIDADMDCGDVDTPAALMALVQWLEDGTPLPVCTTCGHTLRPGCCYANPVRASDGR